EFVHARDRTPGSPPERVGRLDPGRAQRGKDARDQPGRQPEQWREENDTGSEHGGPVAQDGGADDDQDADGPADESAGTTEDRRLDDELGTDVPATGPERPPQADLVDAFHDGDEHRVGDAE